MNLHTSDMAHTIKYKGIHHMQGDELPKFNGKPRLFNMRLCPYAHRTVLALNAKQIDYEIINLDLLNKPAWLFTKNPFGKVPIFEVEDGVTVYESLLTVEYIDDFYLQRPLLPEDALKRIQDKMLVKATEPIESLYMKLMKFPELVSEEGISEYYKTLGYIQEQLKDRRSKFLGGTQPGYVDYMIWPWMERFYIMSDTRVKIDKEKYELLTQYIADMFEDPVVKTYLTPVHYLNKLHEEIQLGTFRTQCLDE